MRCVNLQGTYYKMNDNEKLVLWGILVVLLLIIIGIINPFLLILILSIFIYIQS